MSKRGLLVLVALGCLLGGTSWAIIFWWRGAETSGRQLSAKEALAEAVEKPTAGPVPSSSETGRLEAASINEDSGSFSPAGKLTPGSRERDPHVLPEEGEIGLVWGPWKKGGFTDLQESPAHNSTRLGQLLIGDRVWVVRRKGAWVQVVPLGFKGKSGWIVIRELTLASESVREAWEREPEAVVVTVPGIEIPDGPLLPFSCRLPVVDASDPAGPKLLLPDGRTVQVVSGDVTRPNEVASPEEVRARLGGFRQAPYQVGGNTWRAMDGPGLLWLYLRACGYKPPRRTGRLIEEGRKVPFAEVAPGDVVWLSIRSEERARPLIVLDTGNTFVTATPATGVSFGTFDEIHNRPMVSVRRVISRDERSQKEQARGFWGARLFQWLRLEMRSHLSPRSQSNPAREQRASLPAPENHVEMMKDDISCSPSE